MSNRRRLLGESIARQEEKENPALLTGDGKPVFKWQIRIRSEQPTVIDFKSEEYDTNAPMLECYKLIRRTSFMVNGPNREVWWAIDLWDSKKHKWETVVDGKSTLKQNASAQLWAVSRVSSQITCLRGHVRPSSDTGRTGLRSRGMWP